MSEEDKPKDLDGNIPSENDFKSENAADIDNPESENAEENAEENINEKVNEDGYRLPEKKDYICVINNYPPGFLTERVDRLVDIIDNSKTPFRAYLMHYSELDYDMLCKCKGIILSGSSYNVSFFPYKESLLARFMPVMSIIRGFKSKPILGICFGHHLIAASFNIPVKRMNTGVSGNLILHITDNIPDEIVPHTELMVNVYHKDYVAPDFPGVKEQFDIHALYSYPNYTTVQYMKHKERPIFSLQFHPESHGINYFYEGRYDIDEIHETRIIGEEILFNFLKFCESYSQKD